jgi:hypothetical protein
VVVFVTYASAASLDGIRMSVRCECECQSWEIANLLSQAILPGHESPHDTLLEWDSGTHIPPRLAKKQICGHHLNFPFDCSWMAPRHFDLIVKGTLGDIGQANTRVVWTGTKKG